MFIEFLLGVEVRIQNVNNKILSIISIVKKEISRDEALRMLNLKEGYTPEELRVKYRKMTKVYHPDTGGSHEDFILLKEANELLEKNPLPANSNNQRAGSGVPREGADGKGNKKEESAFKNNKHQEPTTVRTFKERFYQHTLGILRRTKFTLINFIVFKDYLLVSYLSQNALFLYWGWRLARNGGAFSSGILHFLALLLWIFTTNISVIVILVIFHKPNLYKFLRFHRIKPSKLRLIRTGALVLYPILTSPGFTVFLVLYAIGALLNKFF